MQVEKLKVFSTHFFFAKYKFKDELRCCLRQKQNCNVCVKNVKFLSAV